MPYSIRLLLKTIVLTIFVLTGTYLTKAQTSIENFQKILRNQTNFTNDNFSSLEKGETVVKLLPVTDKKEVAIFGIVRMINAPEVSLNEFRDSLAQKENKSLADSGIINVPPNLSEIQSLSLEKKEIEALKKCEVGKCDLKLSAAMINRFKTEIDWNSSDYEESANQLFRQMMLDYVANYSANGNKALIQFDDKKKSVRLNEEHQSLLEKSLFIEDIAPDFANYQAKFPRIDLANVSNDFSWSKIKFGLKPTLTITHTTTYQNQNNNSQQFWVVAKQIYASHYIESSLAFTVLIKFRVNESLTDTYLLFTTRSGSDSLDGFLSSYKRGIVEKEAETKAKELLESTKARIESGSKMSSEPQSQSDEKGMFEVFWSQITDHIFEISLVIVAATILILVYRKRK
jgi:hypothetical protein